LSIVQQTYYLEAFNIFDMEKECRYRLVRVWDKTKPKIGVIMFNPREVNPNPFVLGQTLGKIARLLVNQCGSIEVVNLFAKTSKTKDSLPQKYKKFDEINFWHIQKTVEEVDLVILFWGNGGTKVSKNNKFIHLLKKHENKLRCFGVTKEYQPRYVRTLGDYNQLFRCIIDDKGNISILK
jgi:hypothetical protein